MTKANILYVEDDQTLAFVTRDNLELHDYRIIYAKNGSSSIELFSSNEIDLVILDIVLPDIDGFAIAKNIRAYDLETPILFLSAKTLLEDRIKGLEIGADDYLIKPFSIKELLLKIEVFLKRTKNIKQQPDHMKIGKFIFLIKDQLLILDDKKISLTLRETELLSFLGQQKNEVCKRETILKSIWGDDDYFLGRSLDVFISRLRKLLRGDSTVHINNVHGVGFCLKTKG